MTRNLRAFGLIMASSFALGAVTAQGALGAEEFHTHAKHVVIEGEAHPQAKKQVTSLWVNGVEKATWTCEKVKLEGDSEGTETPGSPPTWTSKELTLHPEYGECTSTFGSVWVNTHECHLKFTAATVSEHADVHVICPTGQSIEINFGGACPIKIGEQNIPGIHYTNVNTTTETNRKELTVHATTGKTIHYTSSGIGCALLGIPASGAEIEINGTATVKAFEYKSGSTGSYTEGSQVGIWKE